MNYVSVCSGIEAATVAWHGLGWRPLLFAEIAKFPSAVLAHHYPEVTNVGDFTQITQDLLPAETHCDLLVGGTPCQAFSVAGLRGGLSDVRGNLALEFMRLADRLRPRWLLWENVPGVLSSNGGRDFGSILGALGELGYGWTYRSLDAQFFGVPQRRRRVFVVGYLGDWRRAAAVLSERTSMRRDTPTRRKTRSQFTGDAEGGTRSSDEVTPVQSSQRVRNLRRGDTRGDHGVVVPFDETQITSKENRSRPENGDPSPTLSKTARPPTIAFHHTQTPVSGSVSPALSVGAKGMGIFVPETAHALTCHAAKGGDPTTDNYVAQGACVRRLTPRECERLQGFPDDYTAIPRASDTARYHALGNSMAVPVMRWIGCRIAFVDALSAPTLSPLVKSSTEPLKSILPLKS